MEEKLLILKMVQEGKITADDAVKLLESLDKNSTSTTPSSSRINEIKDDFTTKLNDMKIDEKLNKIGERASKFAETFGEKAGKFAGQLGENINSEKISTNTEKFAEEFTKRMESLGQDIAESAVNFADTFGYQLGSLFENAYEKYKYNSSYTYPVGECANIYLTTRNFYIKVNPSDTKEITVNVFANSDQPQLVIDEYFKTIVEEKSYRFSSEFQGKTWGRIEIELPKGMDTLSFCTENAKCEIDDMEARYMSCSTTNGKVVLSRCEAEEIEALTLNGKVVLDKISARTANIRAANSKITIEDSHLDNVDARTSNSAILLNVSPKRDSLGSNYILSTSNGKIDVALVATEDFGYMVDAYTTMSNIDVNLPNLTYSMDKKKFDMQNTAQIKSENYDTVSNKITIKADTSNASISIRNI